MGNLSRRGLFGVAGLLATVPITSSTSEVSAQEPWPPEGYTFCWECEGRGWEQRFGAEVDAIRHLMRYDVLFNGDVHLLTFAAVSGSRGWIAEAVRGEPDEDGYRPLTTCECGAMSHLQLRITYGNVELVDHGKVSV